MLFLLFLPVLDSTKLLVIVHSLGPEVSTFGIVPSEDDDEEVELRLVYCGELSLSIAASYSSFKVVFQSKRNSEVSEVVMWVGMVSVAVELVIIRIKVLKPYKLNGKWRKLGKIVQ